MGENRWVPLIIPIEYQLTYPDCKSAKALLNDLFASNYQINGNKEVYLRLKDSHQ